MRIFLGLGSNLGDRRGYLSDAIDQLHNRGVVIRRVSPVIETPALLPDGAPADWNLPYLNLALEAESDVTPERFRLWIKEIQSQIGRDHGGSRWSPRPMDIDILLWGRKTIDTEELSIPHRDLHKRHFVLTPMIALEPRMTIPGRGERTLLDWSRELPHHIPLWMGIINATPDSFSDGGVNRYPADSATSIAEMTATGVNIIDIGGESTRPGATPVGPDEEWRRLEPVLEGFWHKFRGDWLRPMLSIDTYHPETARRAIDAGVDFINDVSGLTDPALCEMASDGQCEWIAMHSVSVPADGSKVLPADRDPVEILKAWLDESMTRWLKAGIDPGRVIFDPGIGFGKDSLQSLKILKRIGEFRESGLRVLAGHSRKSFMKQFSGLGKADKDLVTVGASLHMCQQGVDIIRVHTVPAHTSAYRGWSHLAG